MSGSLHDLSGLDRVIHEPARLMLVALLSSVEFGRLPIPAQRKRLDQGKLIRASIAA